MLRGFVYPCSPGTDEMRRYYCERNPRYKIGLIKRISHVFEARLRVHEVVNEVGWLEQ